MRFAITPPLVEVEGLQVVLPPVEEADSSSSRTLGAAVLPLVQAAPLVELLSTSSERPHLPQRCAIR
jgi:hypothetical protein